MNTRFLIVATVAATAMLGACTSAAPTGPDARAVAPSFELSNSTTEPDETPESAAPVDEPGAIEVCPPPPADSTGVIGISGTYAVAYGTCPTIP